MACGCTWGWVSCMFESSLFCIVSTALSFFLSLLSSIWPVKGSIALLVPIIFCPEAGASGSRSLCWSQEETSAFSSCLWSYSDFVRLCFSISSFEVLIGEGDWVPGGLPFPTPSTFDIWPSSASLVVLEYAYFSADWLPLARWPCFSTILSVKIFGFCFS